ncbi:MAG: thrC, partial [Clostridiales bacterium]|nr:thrC [Clostridiales bacterium]
YEISGRDHMVIRDMMELLRKKGNYEITASMRKNLSDFYGGYASDDETLKGISKVFKDTGYLMDTHTGVAYSVYSNYRHETGDDTKTIILSTASPFKFGRSVCNALGIGTNGLDDFRVIDKLSRTARINAPMAIKVLEDKRIIHNNQCNKNEMKKIVKKFLGV